ncbi:uncharacterized protein zgc:162608 [Thalassophryne amazonica]|uniref:uncharacterized protein zgc:162608 n=1 Tax=Thalassophryne amazonica TaxID=390379 RepID=UPI001470E916|nr:uncharacterized protein zgc:162608 [Thalassophryne amazonica]
MHLKVAILSLLVTTSAFPLQRDAANREATWNDPKANQASDKIKLKKEVTNVYKSHIDSNDLYSQDEHHNQSTVIEEMQHKLNIESERLRARLNQELSELRERLPLYPSHLSSMLSSMSARLAPLTQHLHSSLSSNTKDLCGQLGLHLQSLEPTEVKKSPAAYQEALNWMSQTLEHSSSKMANIISDFHTQTTAVIDHFKEADTRQGEVIKSEIWQEINSRLGELVSSLRSDTQNKVGTLKEELTAFLGTTQAVQADVAGSVERFCQNSALQHQIFQAWMERLFVGLAEDHRSSSLASPPSYMQSLKDFAAQLSALIQDIQHSVQ